MAFASAADGTLEEEEDINLCRYVIMQMPQLKFLDPLLAWLAEQNAATGGFAEGKLDLSRVGVAGHSRGGKLAALHCVGAHIRPCVDLLNNRRTHSCSALSIGGALQYVQRTLRNDSAAPRCAHGILRLSRESVLRSFRAHISNSWSP